MSLALDPRVTALVLIDLQNGILSAPMLPHGRETVESNSLALARRFAERGAPVVLVTVAFSPDLGDRPQGLSDVPMPVPPGGFPPGWSDLAPDLAALPGALRIVKRQWGAFFGTELDVQLRRRGVGTIVLGGISTSIGVEQTAREAWQLNYSVVVAEDACAVTGTDAAMHEHSVKKIFPRLARVRSTGEILAVI